MIVAKFYHSAVTLFYLAAGLFLFASCMTLKAYQGESLPDNDSAIITEHSYAPIYIEKVDDESFRFYHDSAKVLPGTHTLKVKFLTPDPIEERGMRTSDGMIMHGHQKVTFSFQAEAGRVYKVDALLKGRKYWIWVEDEINGKVVGGQKP
jgi:hypothetical protein